MNRRRFLMLGLTLGLTGCAGVPPGELADLARYARIADRLRRSHDRGPLDDRELLALLRELRVAGQAMEPHGRDRPLPRPRYAGGYRWPLDRGIVTSEFGPRWGTLHAGIDITADTGLPVLAAAPGEVVYAGNRLGGYGNVVVLRHDARSTTVYAHNRALRVRAGEPVRQGQVVALLGSTGHATGPHVHFELREGDGRSIRAFDCPAGASESERLALTAPWRRR